MVAEIEPIIEIKVDEAQLRRVENLMREVPNALPKVASRGINRTASSTRTQIVRRLAAEIGGDGDIRQKDIRQGVRIDKKATYASWLAILKLGGRGIPLSRLHPTEVEGGITYRLGGKTYFERHAFLATMPSGHKGVFIRGKVIGWGESKRVERVSLKKKGRGKYVGYTYLSELPIYERFGPAAGTLFERTAQIAKEIIAETGQNLEKNIDREVGLILAGIRT